MPCHHSCFFNWHAKKITKNSCKRQEVQGRGYTLMCERWRIGTLNKFKVVFSCFQLHWYRGFLWSCQILCFRVLVDFKNLSFLHAWAHCSDCKKRWQCIRLRIVGCVCDVQLSSGITLTTVWLQWSSQRLLPAPLYSKSKQYISHLVWKSSVELAGWRQFEGSSSSG